MDRRDARKAIRHNLTYLVRWTLISVAMGLICGLVGTAFGYGVAWSQQFFREYGFMLYLMPVSGIIIVLIHKFFDQIGNKGTNIVLDSILSNGKIRFSLLPSIAFSTILSQLVGASAGKEGAALQIGGCIGDFVGTLIHLDEQDKKIVIMSGMSGCFGAIFGTPLAAAMFGIEVTSIGALYYSALVPCVFASFLGAQISHRLGLHAESFTILHIPAVDWQPMLMIVILGALCAAVSVCFCLILHEAQHLYRGKIKSVYVRILTAAALSIGLTLVFGRTYCGAGFNIVEMAMEGEAGIQVFALKMLFTAVALGGGFKGGEIVPTLAVGSSFGAAFGSLLGFEPSLCAACGLLALFAGVTNCPIATIFLGFELFGFEAMPYFAVVIAVSFTLSGYYGLYSSQIFAHSKTKTEWIDRRAN